MRILIALGGGALLAANPGLTPHPGFAAIGLGVIGVTGVVEWLVASHRWLAFEEAFSCLAVITMVGWSGGHVDAISLLWLVAAAGGVLARGGRIGALARVIVVATLFSPLLTRGGMSAESLGFAFASIALLLATGRISRETAHLLECARHDAAHDSLTGLLSRGAFRSQVDALSALATDQRPAALIAIDLDDFGAVNKRLGHAAGDRLLAAAARGMEQVLREEDILGRLGGDEFAALVFCDDPESTGRRLLEALLEGGASACAGIALAPRDGTGAEALLAAADVALRLTKRGGTQGVGVYDGAPFSSDLVDGARAALERLCRGEGLRIAVQPIVALNTGAAHGYEALARFSTRGGQGPLHWFALADELGMRAELELACLKAALVLLDDLPDTGRLSVNLSAPMLGDERTATLLAEASDLRRLVIEVTEETLVRHGATIERTLGWLRDSGVRFAVDDVGAGYSGLSQLATLRPTYIKLDRGLVRGIDSDPARMALLRALAIYARRTDGLLVAEGVETAAELAHVRAGGAQLAQGYLLSAPGPPWPQVDADALRPPPVALTG